MSKYEKFDDSDFNDATAIDNPNWIGNQECNGKSEHNSMTVPSDLVQTHVEVPDVIVEGSKRNSDARFEDIDDHPLSKNVVNGGARPKVKNNNVAGVALGTIDINMDQIETEEPRPANSAVETLARASLFFEERSDDVRADTTETREDDDDDEPPPKENKAEFRRWLVRRFIEHLVMRVIILLMIVVDVIVMIVDVATDTEDRPVSKSQAYEVVALVFSLIFLIEVCVRIYAVQAHFFFQQWYNVLDFIVVLITLVLCIVVATLDAKSSEFTRQFRLVLVLRLIRVVRLVRLVRIWTEKENLKTGARQMVSQNKKRYQKDGFDLDLTYVTDRVIAMSFPSSGRMAFYRNPIKEVARFLNTKHQHNYRVYNLCSERTYNVNHFGGRVERYMIDDHNVPSLADMLRFGDSIKKWMEAEEHVIAVHCKGGKGRTGTMICVFLVDAGMLSDAQECLDFFGNKRTDLAVSKKFQGVETPSQSRYVTYYEELIKTYNRELPENVPLVITKLSITGLMGVGKGNGSDFSMEVCQGRGNVVFQAEFGSWKNCKSVEYNGERDCMEVTFIDCPTLRGDIRVLFRCSSKDVPRNYENAPFYFWFHTTFIKDHSLYLPREQLDNPHKSKTWHCFRKNFAVELKFSDPEGHANSRL